MKKKLNLWIFALIITSVSFSCNDSETQLPLQGKTYYHSFVSTREECTELLTTFGVNCFQSIEFLDKSTVHVTVTDIITKATYQTIGNNIIVNVLENADFFEAENPMIFEANDDLSKLIRVSANGQVWEPSLPWSE